MSQFEEIQFELEDEELGLRVLFSSTAAVPGDIHVAIFDVVDDDFRQPTVEELQTIEEHCLSTRIRLDLVLASGEKWPSWRSYAARMASMALNPHTAAEA
jgi:hypothetical protein